MREGDLQAISQTGFVVNRIYHVTEALWEAREFINAAWVTILPTTSRDRSREDLIATLSFLRL